MSTSGLIAPLTNAEVETLHECRCEGVRDDLATALSLLADLYQRYTGSMFMVQFPDESVALGLLRDSIARLKGADRFCLRMLENTQKYLGLRAMAKQHGLTDAVRAEAETAVEQLSGQWNLLLRYPQLSSTAGSFAPPAPTHPG